MSEPLWRHVIAPDDRVGRVLFDACRWLAIFGGLMLVAITVMSAGSVLSRWVFGKPLLGDFELVQMGSAIAVSAFLPWCQMRRGHVIVDFFTVGLDARLRAVLDGAGALVLAAVAAIVGWRLSLGLATIRDAGESSMLLAVPIWYAYLPMVPSFLLLAAAGLHTAWAEVRRSAS